MNTLTQSIQLKDLEDLKQLVLRITPQLPIRALILLEGEMGSGKTQFVKTLATVLKLNEIASPSFAIHHRYQNAEHVLDHVDLYRLQDDADLESSGFWDLFSQKQAWIFVEWADRLPTDVVPLNWPVLKLKFNLLPDGTNREVQVEDHLHMGN